MNETSQKTDIYSRTSTEKGRILRVDNHQPSLFLYCFLHTIPLHQLSLLRENRKNIAPHRAEVWNKSPG